ncbi:organic cation transporter protein [Patella vulgata]|uniref:organic cation transporter protein n=1 Tax=Patella vulgata TaxID=6465 RepID=UPI0024A84415|nr:organic cation transporter protein [Patella vulgata]
MIPIWSTSYVFCWCCYIVDSWKHWCRCSEHIYVSTNVFSTRSGSYRNISCSFHTVFVNALVYYGLSLNTENLAGDPYLNFCISGAVEIPANILCIVFLNRVGRKVPLVLSMCVGGIACILSGTIPINGNTDIETLTIVLAMIGKFFISASYAIIYLLAAEVFPTVVRNIGVGVASMSARIGGIMVPTMLDLRSIWTPLPLVIFGSLSIGAGILALLLPETTGEPLPQLLEDVSNKNKTMKLEIEDKGKEKYDNTRL